MVFWIYTLVSCQLVYNDDKVEFPNLQSQGLIDFLW